MQVRSSQVASGVLYLDQKFATFDQGALSHGIPPACFCLLLRLNFQWLSQVLIFEAIFLKFTSEKVSKYLISLIFSAAALTLWF